MSVQHLNNLSTAKFLLLIFTLAWWFFSSENAIAAPECGNLTNAYGPFDYTNLEHFNKKLKVVETHHFTSVVENLIKGQSGTLQRDLDYTLRAFPNHHRALYAYARYEIRERKKSQQNNKPYKPPMSAGGFPATAECYFNRAIRWQPNDPAVRMLYGLYLHLTGDLKKALAEYQVSERMQPKSADLIYNMGLLYFEMKQYGLAKQYATKVYQLGYPLPGLRKKLEKAGQWP